MFVVTAAKAVLVVIVLLAKCDQYQATDNWCQKEESYVEQEQKRTTMPVKVRSYNWCLGIPPRCSNYHTEIKEVIRVQNVTKTRTVGFCCDGYTQIEYENEAVCKPICRGGCGQGYCAGPGRCICEIGYTGRHCTQRCKYGTWGEECKNICKCRNGAMCEHKTGYCRCTEGWIGELCEYPCPAGFYGTMCKNHCECSTDKCDAKTGDCLIDDSIILFDWNSLNSSTPNITNIMKIRKERIEAAAWIKVNGNGKISLKNCSADTTNCDPINGSIEMEAQTLNPVTMQPLSSPNTTLNHTHVVEVLNNNTIIMESINSSIANISENIEKLVSKHDLAENQTVMPAHMIVMHPAQVLTPKDLVTAQTMLPTADAADADAVAGEQLHVATAIVKDTSQENDIPSTILVHDANPETVVHVLTVSHQDLYGTNSTNKSQLQRDSTNTALIVLLVLMVLCILVVLVIFVIYRKQKEYFERAPPPHEDASSNHYRTSGDVKIMQKPLPEIPIFADAMTKRMTFQTPASFYDRPQNNAPVRRESNLSYQYTTSNSSDLSRFYQRDGNIDHLYDEIKYPSSHVPKIPQRS